MLPVRPTRLAMVDSGKKQRILGAGTAAMLICIIALVASRLIFPPKVTIERKVDPSAIGMRIERKPSPTDLLAWSAELGLSKRQYAELEKLAEVERQALAPIDESLKEQEREFQLYMSKQGQKAMSLPDVQLHAKPVSDLSFEKRQLENSYALQGLAVLSDAQKASADMLWHKHSKQKRDQKIGGTRIE